MAIEAFGLNDCDRWDSIVKSFDDYDVYYLSGYSRGFHLHGDGEPLLLYYEGLNGRGISVVMRRDIADIPRFEEKIPAGKLFDYSTPYGYGGWVVEGSVHQELSCEYEVFCQQEGIVSEFVRFHPVLNNAASLSESYEIRQLGPTVALDLKSKDTIWQNITSKNRNMIRKAQKNGIIISHGNTLDLYKKFEIIYKETMDRDEASPYYYFEQSMYDSLREDLPGCAEVFYAELDGEIIATSIILGANGRLNYHLSGSKAEYRSLAPSNLLLYEAACWGAENGFKTFHLGGGVGSREDSLFKFKKSFFRGEPLQYAIGCRIFDEELYRELCNSGSGGVFFPGYRA